MAKGVYDKRSKRKKVSTTFDNDVFDALNKIVLETGNSFSGIVNIMMRQHLINRKRLEK